MRKIKCVFGYMLKQTIKNGVLTHLNTIHKDRLWEKFHVNIKEGNFEPVGRKFLSWHWNWYWLCV